MEQTISWAVDTRTSDIISQYYFEGQFNKTTGSGQLYLGDGNISADPIIPTRNISNPLSFHD